MSIWTLYSYKPVIPWVTFLTPLMKNLFYFQEIKGSQRHTFMVSIVTENENQWSFCLYTRHFVSIKIELHLVHLRYSFTDVPPQPNSQVECVNNKEAILFCLLRAIGKKETDEDEKRGWERSVSFSITRYCWESEVLTPHNCNSSLILWRLIKESQISVHLAKTSTSKRIISDLVLERKSISNWIDTQLSFFSII